MNMPLFQIFVRRVGMVALVAAGWVGAEAAHAQIHKCMVDGVTTFQNTACAVEKPREAPTVEQLNAERKRRQAALNAGQPAEEGIRRPAAEPGHYGAGAATQAIAGTQVAAPQLRPQAANPSAPHAATGGFRCDGRIYCSQMFSCEEAKFFLARCPGTKMDGNGDGVPCEQQWCVKELGSGRVRLSQARR